MRLHQEYLLLLVFIIIYIGFEPTSSTYKNNYLHEERKDRYEALGLNEATHHNGNTSHKVLSLPRTLANITF